VAPATSAMRFRRPMERPLDVLRSVGTEPCD
jgi:hypothetical protein